MGRAGVGGESESDNDKMKSWSQQFINLESHLIHPFICLIYFIIGLDSFEMWKKKHVFISEREKIE